MTEMQWLAGFVSLFLFSFLVHPCTGDGIPERVVVFQGTATDVIYKGDNSKTVHNPRTFTAPAFVGGMLHNKEFLAIICGATLCDSSSSTFAERVVRTSYSNYTEWTIGEVFTNNAERDQTSIILEEFSAVMKEDKIYVLAKKFDKPSTLSPPLIGNNRWNPLMIVGTVTAPTASTMGAASIKWDAGMSLKNMISKATGDVELSQFYNRVGNAVVTKNGSIVFPICLQEATRNEPISSIVYSTDDGKTWKIGGNTDVQTSDGSVVAWGDGKLLFILSSNGGYRKVFESDNMGTTWSESLMFSRVWGNARTTKEYGRPGSAIKVPVDEKDVLLFAHPLSENGGSSIDTLQLWLSDGQRFVHIGIINNKDEHHETGSSILSYVGDNLYVTHEINPVTYHVACDRKLSPWMRVIGMSPLPDFLESVEMTVHAWRALDTKYMSKGVPTNSLVGFLGSTTDASVWKDMYNCVNATVTEGKNVDGGFQFNGKPESGAQWPVASQGQNQVYIFAEKQFTLAATVIIHTGSEKGQFSLIGASLDSHGSNVLIGLGYTHDNKWVVVCDGNSQTTTEIKIERDKDYHVALTFVNRVAAVYVDGKIITSNRLETQTATPISHFYMGGIGRSSSSVKGSVCTVKNVMLFNCNLAQEEIAILAEISKEDKLGEQTSTEQPNAITEDGNSVSTTNSAPVPGESNSVSKTKSTTIADNSKSVLKTDHNTVSVPFQQTVTNIEANGKNMNKSKDALLGGALNKDKKK